ncbi:hypothetical protein SLA2020_151900 [Shorea laevis]
MEICQIPGGFPAIPLRSDFNRTPGKVPPAHLQWSAFLPRVTALSNSPPENSDSESRNRMFILGMGFVAQFLARELRNEGWVVSGTCTSMKKKRELEQNGFDVYLFDANEPEVRNMNSLKCYTHLLVSIPLLMGIGDPVLQHGEFLRSAMMDGNLQWVGYLSSTSVYGDCGGAYVDEDHPTSPTNELARLRLAAEEGWLNLGHDLGLAAQVFRLGGIYGPGRSAIDTIIKQESLSEGQKMRGSRKYTSRVHVEDICQALKASIDMPSSRRIYNVVDDEPAPREEVFAYALDLIEKKWPGLIKKHSSPQKDESFVQGGSSRGEKRVSNSRIKKELGVQLFHPSYKSGLQSIIDQMESPFHHAAY